MVVGAGFNRYTTFIAKSLMKPSSCGPLGTLLQLGRHCLSFLIFCLGLRSVQRGVCRMYRSQVMSAEVQRGYFGASIFTSADSTPGTASSRNLVAVTSSCDLSPLLSLPFFAREGFFGTNPALAFLRRASTRVGRAFGTVSFLSIAASRYFHQ